MKVQSMPMEFFRRSEGQGRANTIKRKKLFMEVDTNVEKLQGNMGVLTGYIKEIKRYSPGVTSREKLENRLEGFVDSYNKMGQSLEDVSDKDIKKRLSKLDDLFADSEKDLKKIGITKENGKIVFDKDKFEDADERYIDKVLVGNDAFIAQADRIMRRAEKSAVNAQYNMVERTIEKTTRSDHPRSAADGIVKSFIDEQV